jgi:hypothetical protein
MAGGGVLGKVAGTAHSIMIGDGVSIEVFHLGMQAYTLVGERIIEPICGEDILGLIATYLTMSFNEIGETGITPATGKIISIGVPKADTIQVDI